MPTHIFLNVKGTSKKLKTERRMGEKLFAYETKLDKKKSMLSLKKTSGSWRRLSKKKEKKNNRPPNSFRLFLTDLYPTRLCCGLLLLFKKCQELQHRHIFCMTKRNKRSIQIWDSGCQVGWNWKLEMENCIFSNFLTLLFAITWKSKTSHLTCQFNLEFADFFSPLQLPRWKIQLLTG